jgi:hypothetical protein
MMSDERDTWQDLSRSVVEDRKLVTSMHYSSSSDNIHILEHMM